MDLVLDYKWVLLIAAETSFWLLSIVFLVLRYWAGFDRASIVFLVLIVVDNLVILGLGALDYLLTGQFEAYQITTVIVLLYGVTFGKRDFKRLDAYLKRKITKRRQRPRKPSTPER